MTTEEYKRFSQEFEDKQELQRCLRIDQLNRETKLLPIKTEILSYIDDFIRILDLSNEWFLRSRFEKDQEKKKLAQVVWEFYDKRADLIVSESKGALPWILTK
ncbi:hypothetical protein C4577_00390 [Candidatus Parcubacteria bacterium]|nr:MAG: hypothetical protein C4577_00390 [Candidatus Parcubacteria bacterium]